MSALGATRVVRRGYTAYVWGSRLGDLFLIGLGVLDGRFLLGPRRLRQSPSRLGSGSYTIIDLSSEVATVQPDPFGMCATYVSRDFVTNRLHLAAIVHPEINVDNALSVTYNDGGFSFSLNSFGTPLRGVSLLPVGASVRVTSDRVEVIETDFGVDDILEPSEYWELIEQGAEEIVENVVAVVESGLPVFADVTGGRDSRVVFGALVAAGLQRDVVFNTITNPATPELREDLEIGTGLVSLYGGSYGDRPRAVAYAEHSVDQNLQRRRSQILGTYHWIVPTDLRPVVSVTKVPTIRMLGGGGELYRDYWGALLFSSVDPESMATEDVMRDMLVRHRGKALGSMYFERYASDLVGTFMALPGSSVGHKLDAHYLNFRNRFHFGLRQSSPESMSTINVATSRALLNASRGLPASERSTGRVLFDVTRVFDEKLAHYRYDKPGDARIFSSPYHRVSIYGEEPLPLEAAVASATQAQSSSGFLRPQMPSAAAWDFNEILDNEINESIEVLSSGGSAFSFLVDGTLLSYVEWARAHSPRNRSSLASKLRSFADYDLLTR